MYSGSPILDNYVHENMGEDDSALRTAIILHILLHVARVVEGEITKIRDRKSSTN